MNPGWCVNKLCFVSDAEALRWWIHCFKHERKTANQNISKVGTWKVASLYYRVPCNFLLYNKPEKWTCTLIHEMKTFIIALLGKLSYNSTQFVLHCDNPLHQTLIPALQVHRQLADWLRSVNSTGAYRVGRLIDAYEINKFGNEKVDAKVLVDSVAVTL